MTMLNREFFLKPIDPMQRRYEALRAAYVDNLSNEEICKRFGYTLYSFKSLKRDSKELKTENFFKDLKKGPKGPHQKTLSAKNTIVSLRKKGFSVTDIQQILRDEEGIALSLNHINKILRQKGFLKLSRRTNKKRIEVFTQGITQGIQLSLH